MCVPYVSMYVSSLQSSKGHNNASSPHVRMIAYALVTDVHTDAKSLAHSPSKHIAVELRQVPIPMGSLRRRSHHITTYVRAHAQPTLQQYVNISFHSTSGEGDIGVILQGLFLLSLLLSNVRFSLNSSQ
jgi:hypothetical protein